MLPRRVRSGCTSRPVARVATLLPPLPAGENDSHRLRRRNLSEQGFYEWAVLGSNQRPPACRAGALPTELTARARDHIKGSVTPDGVSPPAGARSARRARRTQSPFAPVAECYDPVRRPSGRSLPAPAS